MDATLKLGRVAGIDVGLNWSWLIAAGLIVWVLAEGVFPESNPGLDDGAYLAMAATAVVLFFGSILLHELGHAVQARREGMGIEGITLWVFGGVAQFRGSFPSAAAELRRGRPVLDAGQPRGARSLLGRPPPRVGQRTGRPLASRRAKRRDGGAFSLPGGSRAVRHCARARLTAS